MAPIPFPLRRPPQALSQLTLFLLMLVRFGVFAPCGRAEVLRRTAPFAEDEALGLPPFLANARKQLPDSGATTLEGVETVVGATVVGPTQPTVGGDLQLDGVFFGTPRILINGARQYRFKLEQLGATLDTTLLVDQLGSFEPFDRQVKDEVRMFDLSLTA